MSVLGVFFYKTTNYPFMQRYLHILKDISGQCKNLNNTTLCQKFARAKQYVGVGSGLLCSTLILSHTVYFEAEQICLYQLSNMSLLREGLLPTSGRSIVSVASVLHTHCRSKGSSQRNYREPLVHTYVHRLLFSPAALPLAANRRILLSSYYERSSLLSITQCRSEQFQL